MRFNHYEVGNFFDEMFSDAGCPRVAAQALIKTIESLPDGELLTRQQAAERALLQMGITFNVYDSVYRTRAIGSTVWQNNRFFSDNKILLLPDEQQLQQIDDTEIGFAKTLTSPHPEGNWASGYYEWEDEKRDPWIHVRGSGIKAFPVFPFMQYSAVMVVM